MTKIDLVKTVGGGYGSFWRCKKRYRICKGSRGSKKSCTTALWIIYKMMEMPLANTLVMRRYFNTHKDSTFAQLKWAINKWGVKDKWKVTNSPMELTYLPTGQKILFRGFDDADSITSITVETGFLCWVWIEEAFQVTDETAFNKLDMSIRGEVPEGYFKQITMTFNPWSDKTWIKRRFFDAPDDNVFAITTTYMQNEFLGDDDRALFEQMKIRNPRRYKIEGLGDWGISEGLIYENWTLEDFDISKLMYLNNANGERVYRRLFGLDFGFSNDPAAVMAMLGNRDQQVLYIYDEIYEPKLTNSQLADRIKYKGWANAKIKADCSEPKSIKELRDYGIKRVYPCKKGADSLKAGIRRLQDYQLIVHPTCTNTIIELNNYAWDVKDGLITSKPIDDYNHLMDAMRYGSEEMTIKKFSW